MEGFSHCSTLSGSLCRAPKFDAWNLSFLLQDQRGLLFSVWVEQIVEIDVFPCPDIPFEVDRKVIGGIRSYRHEGIGRGGGSESGEWSGRSAGRMLERGGRGSRDGRGQWWPPECGMRAEGGQSKEHVAIEGECR